MLYEVITLATDMFGAQWIITSYMIAAAIALLITEYLIKSLGAKGVFLLGVGARITSYNVCYTKLLRAAFQTIRE